MPSSSYPVGRIALGVAGTSQYTVTGSESQFNLQLLCLCGSMCNCLSLLTSDLPRERRMLVMVG